MAVTRNYFSCSRTVSGKCHMNSVVVCRTTAWTCKDEFINADKQTTAELTS